MSAKGDCGAAASPGGHRSLHRALGVGLTVPDDGNPGYLIPQLPDQLVRTSHLPQPTRGGQPTDQTNPGPVKLFGFEHWPVYANPCLSADPVQRKPEGPPATSGGSPFDTLCVTSFAIHESACLHEYSLPRRLTSYVDPFVYGAYGSCHGFPFKSGQVVARPSFEALAEVPPASNATTTIVQVTAYRRSTATPSQNAR